MLTWRELTRKERANYYHNRLENDFPADEVKPLASIEMMYLRGIYLFCGFFEDDRPIGYACMMTPKEGEFTLLDYFPKDFTPRQKVELIESLVKEWHEKQMVQAKPSVQKKLKKIGRER